MNIDELNQKWQHIQQMIRQQWPELTEEDMSQLTKGEVLLSDLLQTRYHLAAAEARTAVDRFSQQFNL